MDWERFGSRPEAEARAGELVRPFETYAIEEYVQACPRYRDVSESEGAHPQVANAALEAGLKPSVKYSWQQAVLDAFTEMRSEYLMGKINAAERAISARLCELAPSDMDEQAAIAGAGRAARNRIDRNGYCRLRRASPSAWRGRSRQRARRTQSEGCGQAARILGAAYRGHGQRKKWRRRGQASRRTGIPVHPAVETAYFAEVNVTRKTSKEHQVITLSMRTPVAERQNAKTTS